MSAVAPTHPWKGMLQHFLKLDSRFGLERLDLAHPCIDRDGRFELLYIRRFEVRFLDQTVQAAPSFMTSVSYCR